MDRCAVGIDLGGTNLLAGLVDSQGRILARRRQPTPVGGGPDALLAAMRQAIRQLMAEAGGRQLLGIGVGIPGLLDREAGVCLFAPNLNWHRVPVGAALAEFGLPVAMDGDVRCHALAELHFGAGRGIHHFLLITLGTGIGSGIVIGGQLYRGPAGLAGEIGHIPLDPAGPLCGCGKRGCFEALAGGKAIGRRAREAGLGETARDLFARAAAGDPRARALVDQVAHDLGRGIATYANIMNPLRVIVGGGVAQAGDLLFTPLRRHAESETMPGIRGTYDIVPAALGDEAGAVGAAALVPGLVST